MSVALQYQRLGIGTAQFGLPYGIANSGGQVSDLESRQILERAWAAGVNTLDTANAYGVSEERLGMVGVGNWRVISKLRAIPNDCLDIEAWLFSSLESCLQRLCLKKIAGLLLHHPEQILQPFGPTIYKALQQAKAAGLVEKIGVSIYDPNDLGELTSRYDFDLVQAPLNVLDRRLVESGWLGRLQAAKIEVHVRSIFFQGLLLLGPEKRPAKFSRWNTVWEVWDEWLNKTGQTALESCLQFVWRVPGLDRVIVGFDCLAQLDEVLNSINLKESARAPTLECDDVDLLNPSRWNYL